MQCRRVWRSNHQSVDELTFDERASRRWNPIPMLGLDSSCPPIDGRISRAHPAHSILCSPFSASTFSSPKITPPKSMSIKVNDLPGSRRVSSRHEKVNMPMKYHSPQRYDCTLHDFLAILHSAFTVKTTLTWQKITLWNLLINETASIA